MSKQTIDYFRFNFETGYKRLILLARRVTLFNLTILSSTVCAQDTNISSSAGLRKLSVEELMNLEVTLVSRSPQKPGEASSAVQIMKRTVPDFKY